MLQKRLLFIIAFHITLVFAVQSQQWVWDTTALWQQSWPVEMRKDNFHQLYVYTPSHDSVVRKFSTSGKPLSTINLPKNFKIRSLTCSSDSSLYILGLFTGTLAISSQTIISKGGQDLCIAKYSQSGNLIWLTSAGSKRDETANDICMHGTDVVITGTVKDTMYFQNLVQPKTDTLQEIFVARFFKNGNIDKSKIFKRFYHTQYDKCEAWEVEVDNSGNIYTLAYVRGKILVDKDTITGQGSYCLIKFDSALNYMNHALLASYYSTSVSDIRFNSQNEIYYVFHPYTKYNSHADLMKLSSITGSATAHYSTAGYIPAIDLDSCDNVYFIGGKNNSYPGPYIPQYWSFVGMLSPTGNLNWLHVNNSPRPLSGVQVVSTELNKCYAMVYFYDSIKLLNTYTAVPSTFRYLHAILQATFGLPSNVTPLANQSICINKSTSLICNTGGAISWYNSPTSQSPIFTGNTFTTPPLSAGTYTWYAEAKTCTMTTGRVPVTVTVNPNPIISASSGSICQGQSFTLNPLGANSYSFNGHGNVVSPFTTTSYTIIGTDGNMCQNSAVSTVTVKTLPSLSFQSTPQNLCLGETVTITASGGQQYLWSTGSTQNQISLTPTAAISIWVQATDTHGCSNTVSYSQTLKNCTGVGDESLTANYYLYPNPVTDNVFILLKTDAEITITNCSGQELKHFKFKGGEQTINLADFSEGMYLINLRTENSSQTRKIIVQ